MLVLEWVNSFITKYCHLFYNKIEYILYAFTKHVVGKGGGVQTVHKWCMTPNLKKEVSNHFPDDLARTLATFPYLDSLALRVCMICYDHYLFIESG